jgi:hypothetical protein
VGTNCDLTLGADRMPPPPPPQDAVLLRDDDIAEEVREDGIKRRRLLESSESFHTEAFGLQLPQLISNDIFTERQRYTTGMSATEKKIDRDPPGFNSLEDLVRRIETTFEQAREIPVHPHNPNLKPRRVMPIVPDAVLWGNKYKQVVFDEIPREPRQNDILFKTVPTPRATVFSYFNPADANDTFEFAQDYIWDNRGGYNDYIDTGEGKTLILSLPPADHETGEVRFSMAPPTMKLKKRSAMRLDVPSDARELTVSFREPSAQEQSENRDRMAPVLSDEILDDRDC